MAFKDLGDWSVIGSLELPINGKIYRLPPVSAELGPRLQALVSFSVDVAQGKKNDASSITEADRVVLDDIAEENLYREILGDVHDEMTADGVPWAALKHAAMTSMFDAVLGRDPAERYWETQGKVPAPNRQTRRSTPTAAAIKAKKPASTAGTTSRRNTGTAAKGTTGRKSSSTGR